MFICTGCSSLVGPKISPITRVLETRPVHYTNKIVRLDEYERETEEIVESDGVEIAREGKLCSECAQQEAPTNTSSVIKRKFDFEEPLPEPMRVKFISIVLHSTLDRLNQSSHRAKRDAETAVPLIKRTVDANPKLIF